MSSDIEYRCGKNWKFGENKTNFPSIWRNLNKFDVLWWIRSEGKSHRDEYRRRRRGRRGGVWIRMRNRKGLNLQELDEAVSTSAKAALNPYRHRQNLSRVNVYRLHIDESGSELERISEQWRTWEDQAVQGFDNRIALREIPSFYCFGDVIWVERNLSFGGLGLSCWQIEEDERVEGKVWFMFFYPEWVWSYIRLDVRVNWV